MSSAVDLSLERSAEEATLSLHGVVRRSDIVAAARVCMALPHSVRMLRIDARYVTDLQQLAAPVLRSLLRRWRRGHHGYVELRIDQRVLHLLIDPPTPPAMSAPIAVPARPADGYAALTAAFL